MYIEMNCSCTATLMIDMDKGNSDALMLLVNRFTAAHVACGFVTALPADVEVAEETRIFNININEQDK